MSWIGYALRMAKRYYDSKTYDHAIRVAGYVADNSTIPDNKMDMCISLAIMHDLVEDTEYKLKMAPDELARGLDILTNDDKCFDYIDYIKNIASNKDECTEAYWVKLADMKDHLAQTETLTDKLKEKYLAALPYLL